MWSGGLKGELRMTRQRVDDASNPRPRLILFANNQVGLSVARYLKGRGEDILGVVVHPAGHSKFRDEILESTGVPKDHVKDAADIVQREGLAWLTALSPSVAVSAFFGHILPKAVIERFPGGILNVHPALLPYNRGVNTNVWPIVERTPAGVTIHYIDEKIDTGDIVAQREVPVLPTDTGLSLYRRLEDASVALFVEVWPSIVAGTASRRRQDPLAGTFHRSADVSQIDEIDLDAKVTARELVDRMRARSFPPYDGAYFTVNGRRVYLRLELYEAEKPESGC